MAVVVGEGCGADNPKQGGRFSIRAVILQVGLAAQLIGQPRGEDEIQGELVLMAVVQIEVIGVNRAYKSHGVAVANQNGYVARTITDSQEKRLDIHAFLRSEGIGVGVVGLVHEPYGDWRGIDAVVPERPIVVKKN